MNLTDKAFVMCNAPERSLKSFYLLMFMHLVLILFAGLFQACDKGIIFPDDPAFEEHTLPPFGEINVTSIFDIELKNDSLYSIRLEGNRKVLQNISFDVHGDTLKLSDTNSWSWLPDYPRPVLIISFPDLRRIWIDSPSNIFSADTLFTNRLSIISAGMMAEIDLTLKTSHLHFTTGWNDFGHYTFRGYSKSTDIRIYGSAQLKAGGLHTENTSVRNYSISDCYVRADKQLRTWLGHYGNIYYYGSPDEIIIERMNSRGRLISLPQTE